MNSNWSYSPETLNSGQNWQYFVPSDLEIWWMTLENNRAPLLYYIKLCASFQIHGWSWIWFTVRKRPIQVKIGDFLSCVTKKLDGWHWKTIGHLFYNALSFMQHFKAISIIKLELQSGNPQFGSKLAIFYPITLKIDRWPWKTIAHLSYAASSSVHHFVAIGWFKLEVQPEMPNLGQNWWFFCPVWPWNLMDDLEKQ